MNAARNLIDNPSEINTFAEFARRCGGGPVLATARWDLNWRVLDRTVDQWRSRLGPHFRIDCSWHPGLRNFYTWRSKWPQRYRRYTGLIIITCDSEPFDRWCRLHDAWKAADPRIKTEAKPCPRPRSGAGPRLLSAGTFKKAPRSSLGQRLKDWRRQEPEPPTGIVGQDHFIGLATTIEVLSIALYRPTAPLLWYANEPPMTPPKFITSFAVTRQEMPGYTSYAELIPWSDAAPFDPMLLDPDADWGFQLPHQYVPLSFLSEVGLARLALGPDQGAAPFLTLVRGG
jgi:hypothetical protein